MILCDPVDYSMPGFPVLHYLPEFAQTHVHLVGDVVQPSHRLLPSSPPVFNLSQHQGLFQWVFTSGGQSIRTSASVLTMNIQGWFPLGLTCLVSLLSRVFSSTTIWKHQFFWHSVFFVVQLSHLCMTTGKKNHSFDHTDLCWQSDVSAL